MGITSPVRRRSQWLLASAFGLIAVLVALTDAIALGRWRSVQDETRASVRSALASVDVVSRMGRDIDRVRLLVDAQVFESEAAPIAAVDARIAAARRDLAGDAARYERLATLPEERAAWEDLQRDLAAVETPLDSALRFSRANRDPEARATMRALEDRFAAIEREMTSLIQINRGKATGAEERMEAAQRSLTTLLVGLSAAGIAVTVVVGAFAVLLVRRREGELERQSVELEERNRDLDAFAGRVAHDLRAPLTTLKLAASRLPKGEQAAQPGGALFRRAIDRMETLIDELLALSRIGSQASGTGDPAAAAAHVREELAPRFTQEGVVLHVAVEPSQIPCSEGLLRQVLSNLLDNAVKYRRAEVPPEILLSGRAAGERYELRVTDNGTGMSEEEVQQIFLPFYRALRVELAPGTGLGLSIVKRIVEASGGTVSVQSRLGEGTSFVMAWPLRRHSPRVSRAGERGTRAAAAPEHRR